jgi:hypothetical protein
MKKEKDYKIADAYFRLAQLLATIAGFLIIGFSVFVSMSFSAYSLTTQYVDKSITIANNLIYLNNTEPTLGNAYLDSLTNATESMGEVIDNSLKLENIFLNLSFICTILAIFFWYKGYGIVKS